MAAVTVDRNLFGLIVQTEAADHPALKLVRRLPQRLRIPPSGPGERNGWIVALSPEILPAFRKIYKMGEEVEFSLAAIEALKQLRATQDAMTVAAASVGRSRVEIRPDVSASLRGLQPTLDRISSGVTGPEHPGEMTVLSSEKELQ